MKCFLISCFMLVAAASGKEIRRAIPVHAEPIYAGFNDDALLLAGIPLPPTSPLVNLQLSKTYQDHVLAMQKAWDDYEQRQFTPMKQWSQRELPARTAQLSVVTYLFSGPDILNPLALFPDASIYLLCGKEPLGAITPPEQLSPEQLQAGLTNLRDATQTALRYGYFITKEMRSQITAGPFQGTLPLLLTFLALTGHQIITVERLPLGGASGLCIRFSNQAGIKQTLYYAQQDLSNESSQRFLRWLQGFKPGIAYLKAASYLLHEESFSRTRDALLTHSKAIIQDDSGIPFRYFDSVRWTLYLFGDYKGPIEIFRSKYQSDLFNAYHESLLASPMNFGTGYQFQAGASGGANLLLAVKRAIVPKALAIDLSPMPKRKH